jgi:hypothetical protein
VSSLVHPGELLRRYWHPVSVAAELTEEKLIKALKLLAGVERASSQTRVTNHQHRRLLDAGLSRIGLLMPFDENEPVVKARLSAFTQPLAQLGWTDGRKVRMELRRGGDDINRIRAHAQELVGVQPDITLADSTTP